MCEFIKVNNYPLEYTSNEQPAPEDKHTKVKSDTYDNNNSYRTFKKTLFVVKFKKKNSYLHIAIEYRV